jgi:hypothetical protein
MKRTDITLSMGCLSTPRADRQPDRALLRGAQMLDPGVELEPARVEQAAANLVSRDERRSAA